MKGTLVIIALISLIAVGGYFLFSGGKVSTSPNDISEAVAETDVSTDSEADTEDGTENETTTDISTGNKDTADETIPETTSGTGDQGSQTDLPTSPDEGPLAVTVTYTDSSFGPATTEIKRGDTVTFVNQSNRGMWVASAIHPTHTLYPEKSSNDCFGSSFDACTQISPGNSWSFTFNSVGSWNYHNHARPNHTGVVVVE